MRAYRFPRGSSDTVEQGGHESAFKPEPPVACTSFTGDFSQPANPDRRLGSPEGGQPEGRTRRFFLRPHICIRQSLRHAARELLCGETDFTEIYRRAVAVPETDNKLAKWSSAKLNDRCRRMTSSVGADPTSPLNFFLLRFKDPQTEKEYVLVCNHLCIVRFVFQLLIHHAVIMPILYVVFSATGAHNDYRIYFPPLEIFYSVYFSLAVGLGLILAVLLAFPAISGAVGEWVRRRALTTSYVYIFLMVTGYCIPFAALERSFETPRKEAEFVGGDFPAEWQPGSLVDAGLIRALLGTERIFVDTTLFSVYLFGSSILWLDLLAPSLVRLTAFLHIWIPSAFACIFVIAYIYSQYVNPAALATVICLFYSLSLWSYAGRYATELQHRIVFLNWRNSRERLFKLAEQSQQSTSNLTAVDGMMAHLHQMDRMIKQLMLLRGSEGSESHLEQMEILVKELEDTLKNSGDIYSLLLQEDDPFSRNFMELHMRLAPLSVERKSLGGSSGREQSFGSFCQKRTFFSKEGSKAEQAPASFEEFHARVSAGNRSFSSVVSETWQGLADHVGVDWDFNLIEVEEETGHVLVLTGLVLLDNVVTDWGCQPSTLTNFLLSCAMQHQPNPYHNQRHAAMVAHATSWLANTAGVLAECDSVERATLYVAALCHDLGHPGRTNQFFVTSCDPLAIVYNDISCLENLHCCLCFRTLEREENNVFYHLDNEHFRFVRSKLIEVILATDMKQHFEAISRFRLRRSADDFDVATRVEDRWAVLKMSVKMADISHVALPWDMHFRLSCDIVEEFYQQGDEELRRGMPVSMLCDRSKHNEMAKAQEGFLEYLAKPLLAVLLEGDPTGRIQRDVADQMENNLQRWKQMAADQVVISLQPVAARTQTRTFTAAAVRRVAGLECTQASPSPSHVVARGTETEDKQGGNTSSEAGGCVNQTRRISPASGAEMESPPRRRPWTLGFLVKNTISMRKSGRHASLECPSTHDQEDGDGQREPYPQVQDTLNWGALPFEATNKEAGPILFTQNVEVNEA
ncbi:3'5'-cyclic nucleotide phosphodiesterase domain-containing protein [Besnoitia besnoiti]|uniref:Phosphodiesterase n=1 Tax=Besnoitia besnoiti TaxID=94643 RepID=A0A2A9MFM0_BESBE|nr:3'5'-cyclic nucleotide phosphodiesterase domain-containing protein [Besnoitia besnoiti]PFH36785.1 3'5'-cyclic nucleotide phosphodiesterase domain-containing protein [Besnoitia besnoiti]